MEQLAEDQYFGDEQLGFVVPDNDITGSSTPQSRLADPADTSNDQVLLLDNEGDGGINEHSLNGPSFGGGFSFSGGYGSAGGDSGDSCVPQLVSISVYICLLHSTISTHLIVILPNNISLYFYPLLGLIC